MKNFKRVFSVVLMLAMLVPLCAFSASADDYSTNWNGLACKYSSSTDKIIAPKSVIKSEGFTFTQNANDGIDVTTPDVTVFKGTYPVAAVASKSSTPLAWLSVKLSLAAGSNFAPDGSTVCGNYSMLWSESPITTLCNVETQDGLYWGNCAISNGLRQLAPDGVKGLSILVANNYAAYYNTKTASTVYVSMMDGVFYDQVDGREGYRWSFIARNNPQTPNADSTTISRPYEEIDCTNGITFGVRPDTTLGYVAMVNGKEYYKGLEVGYFPNDNKGSGAGGAMTEDDIINLTPAYLNSMTYARADINLSALSSVAKGYVTVGSVGNGNDVPNCNYTLDTVNDIPAAKWKGEAGEARRFSDVADGKWYTEAVLFCDTNGFMNGTTPTTFEPKTIMNRAMFATILYKIDGADETYDTMSFADVKPGQWYSNAIEWAYQNEYSTGIGTDEATNKPIYGRKNDVSREQLALFFYNYSAKKGYDVTAAADLSAYTDLDRVHDWALDAMKWAVAEELVSGTTDITLAPRNSASRAEVATIIMKYVTTIIPTV